MNEAETHAETLENPASSSERANHGHQVTNSFSEDGLSTGLEAPKLQCYSRKCSAFLRARAMTVPCGFTPGGVQSRLASAIKRFWKPLTCPKELVAHLPLSSPMGQEENR